MVFSSSLTFIYGVVLFTYNLGVYQVYIKHIRCEIYACEFYIYETHMNFTRVMLHIIPLSSFCPLKIDVALKITIGSKLKSDISKIQW